MLILPDHFCLSAFDSDQQNQTGMGRPWLKRPEQRKSPAEAGLFHPKNRI
jgi:hypothetical protein